MILTYTENVLENYYLRVLPRNLEIRPLASNESNRRAVLFIENERKNRTLECNIKSASDSALSTVWARD